MKIGQKPIYALFARRPSIVMYVDDGISVDFAIHTMVMKKNCSTQVLQKKKTARAASQNQQGVLRDKILSDIRESVNEDNLSHEHLLERKDLTSTKRLALMERVPRRKSDSHSYISR